MRLIACLAIVFVCLALCSRAQTINLSQGLKLYLPCTGNANDQSGNGNNAIVSGATLTTDEYGIANSAYEFDGINDYLQVPNNSSLQITDSITLTARVFVTGFYNGLCQSNCIITKGNNDFGNGHYSLRFGDAPFDNNCNQFNPNNETFYGHMKNLGAFPNGAGPGQAGAPPYIQLNQWYCVIYSWDGDSVRMYVNGVLRFKYQYSNQPNGTNNDDVFIGKRNDGTYQFLFKGKMDEIRIYNRTLNPAELNAVCTDCSYFHIFNNNIITTSDTSICGVVPVTLGANPSLQNSSIAYSWAPNIGINTTNTATPTITASATTTYTVNITDSNQCIARDSITISVFGSAPVSNAGPDKTICAGTGASVQLQGSGGGTYFWQPSTSLNSSTLSNPTASPNVTTTYTLTVSNAVGCVATDVVTVFVTPPPDLHVADELDTVCIGSSLQMAASGAATYLWSGNNLSNTTSALVTASPLTSTVYTVTGTSTGGCTSTATVQVFVAPLPVLQIQATDSICVGESTDILVSGADFLQWQPAANIVPLPNGTGVQVTPQATTIYTINASSAIGCTFSTQVKIEVSQQPQFTLSKSGDVNCQTKRVTITASNMAYQYIWSPQVAVVEAKNTSIIVAPLANTTYTVTGVNGKCVTSQQITVNVTAKPPVEYFAPNAFTPNDDGDNDCFRVKVLNGSYNSYHLRIFNRWGQCVFHTQDPNQCWYGEQRGIIPEGVNTYYYLLQIDDGCSPVKEVGSIQLIQ